MQFEIPRPDPVRLVACVRSRERELVDRITQRFKMEFGFAPEPEILETLSGGGSDGGRDDRRDTRRDGRTIGRWLPLAGHYDPGEFASLQTHARRVEALYPDASGEPKARIDLVYVRRSQVVLATRSEAVHRIFLGQGVWAEVALERAAAVDAAADARAEGGGGALAEAKADADAGAGTGPFRPNPWTEDAMKTERALEFFAAVADRAQDAHGGAEPGRAVPNAARVANLEQAPSESGSKRKS